MKYILSLVFSIMCLFQGVNAATFHAILITANHGEGGGFESSMDLMKREMKKIAAAGKMELNLTTVEDHQTTYANIEEYLSNLDIKSDDVVFMYAMVHGTRSNDKETQWPDLIFVDGEYDSQSLVNIVRAKNPRLFINIIESCNDFDKNPKPIDAITLNFLLINQAKPQSLKASSEDLALIEEGMKPDEIQNYRKLFREQKGFVMISSSKPGQKSLKHDLLGGIYTIAFLKALKDSTAYLFYEEGKPMSWNSVFDLSKEYLGSYKSALMPSFADFEQTPQLVIQ